MQIAEIKNKIPPRKALICFDYGEKRLGVAVSDISLMIATPYKIIYRKSFADDLAEIKKIVTEKEVGAMLFGLPLQMNGTEGQMAEEVRNFAAKLQKKLNLEVFFWDERLSSSAAENMMIKQADLSRKKRKERLDASAAAYILQGFLDRISI